jgi:hypothetical protein
MNIRINRSVIFQVSDIFLQRWHNAVTASQHILSALHLIGSQGDYFVRSTENPFLALADANLGDFKSAHALVDTSPIECAPCLRIRGRIDALEKNWGGAEYWFRRAKAFAPSIPFPDADWGQMLLAKGDASDAVVKLARAHTLGPHFADPLEMWGEALILQNRSDLALAKFVEAGKYAPHWGRLHLKWGEALRYAGRNADAKTQFALTAQYEMTPAEKAELARQIAIN